MVLCIKRGYVVTQFDKFIERIRARPPEADFRDVCKLLEAFRWTLDREKSSHVVFTKPGERSIIDPQVKGRKVKKPYLNMICERLGLDD
jgi:predicted RNA binding protein YcfA (HicA-like mRNA interferase family)